MKKAWVLSYPLSTQRRLIRPGRCPGWSESSLGEQSFCWFCHGHEVSHMRTATVKASLRISAVFLESSLFAVLLCRLKQQNFRQRLSSIILAYPTRITLKPTGARKCRLTWGDERWLLHDVRSSFWRQVSFWCHHISFWLRFPPNVLTSTSWKPNRAFLFEKYSYFSIKLIK